MTWDEWCESIFQALMPRKIFRLYNTLLYWFCKRTKIVELTEPTAVPRFLKWDLSLLRCKLRTVKLRNIPDEKIMEQELKKTKRGENPQQDTPKKQEDVVLAPKMSMAGQDQASEDKQASQPDKSTRIMERKIVWKSTQQ